MATPFRRIARHVPQDVELVLLSPDAFESTQQVVGVENRESARSFRQRSQDLLVGRSRRWEWRHDSPRLVVGQIVKIIGASIVPAATTGPASRATASGAAFTATSGTTTSARAAFTTTSCAASARTTAATATSACSTPNCTTPATAAATTPASSATGSSAAATARPLRIRHGHRRIGRKENVWTW